MPSKTTNYGLLLPEDFSEQWGTKLNKNFESIDTFLYSNYQIVRSSLNNSGLVEGVNRETEKKPTVNYDKLTRTLEIRSAFKVYFPDKKVIFTSEELPGVMNIADYRITISEIEQALGISRPAENAPIYYQFYFGLRFKMIGELASYDKIITLNRDDFKVENKEDIYLGSAVIYYDTTNARFEIANELICFKPWFSNTQSEDRVMYTQDMGNFTSGKVKVEGTKLKIQEQFSWIYEGIKYWSTRNPNFIESFVETTQSPDGRPTDVIKFFYACADGKISGSAGEDELAYNNTDIKTNHYCYKSGSQWLHGTVPTGKYTIQRLGVIENLKAVVFYGDKIYDTYGEARAALSQLSPINTTVPVKEIARIIVRSQTGTATIPADDLFNLDEINESFLPKGGTAGDVLMKAGNDDNNVIWGKPTVSNFAIYWKKFNERL